jgi:transposase
MSHRGPLCDPHDGKGAAEDPQSTPSLPWLARAGALWRPLPHDLPLWAAVYQQPQRWLKASAFETNVRNPRVLLRLVDGRTAPPAATMTASLPQ